jgi:PIN domain nuclease of toxin-antitoxin system
MDELLLDSSYLFPIFGIELEYRNFESIFSKLPEKYLLKYNPVSLIEAKWYVLRKSKKDKWADALFQSYRRGLLSLQRDKRIESTSLTNERIEELADSLLTKFSIRDYFDRLIYSTAAELQCILLTEDGPLHEVFRRAQNIDLPKPKQMMKWKDLTQTAY